MDLISIIIPVYNKKEYLSNCLESLKRQTYKNIEIILVDDGSTDGSNIICDEYAENCRKIHVFHKMNNGVSSARNYGIKKANGKFVLFIDADDEVMPNYVEKLYYTLIQKNVDIVICSIRENYYYKNKVCRKLDRKLKLMQGNIMEDFNHLYFNDNFYMGANVLKIYRMNLIKKYDLRFREDLASGEDYAFNLSYYEVIKTYCTIPDILYTYNKYLKGGNIYDKLDDKRIINERKIIEITEKYVKKHNLLENIILGEIIRIVKNILNIILLDKSLDLKQKYFLFKKTIAKLDLHDFLYNKYKLLNIKHHIALFSLKFDILVVFFVWEFIKKLKVNEDFK